MTTEKLEFVKELTQAGAVSFVPAETMDWLASEQASSYNPEPMFAKIAADNAWRAIPAYSDNKLVAVTFDMGDGSKIVTLAP